MTEYEYVIINFLMTTIKVKKKKIHKDKVVKNNANMYFDDFEKESRKVIYKL